MPTRYGGSIWVQAILQSEQRSILISVRDEGVGLPPGFDPATSKQLGSRMVTALSKQLGGEITRPTSSIGTNFSLLIPLGPATTE